MSANLLFSLEFLQIWTHSGKKLRRTCDPLRTQSEVIGSVEKNEAHKRPTQGLSPGVTGFVARKLRHTSGPLRTQSRVIQSIP